MENKSILPHTSKPKGQRLFVWLTKHAEAVAAMLTHIIKRGLWKNKTEKQKNNFVTYRILTPSGIVFYTCPANGTLNKTNRFSSQDAGTRVGEIARKEQEVWRDDSNRDNKNCGRKSKGCWMASLIHIYLVPSFLPYSDNLPIVFLLSYWRMSKFDLGWWPLIWRNCRGERKKRKRQFSDDLNAYGYNTNAPKGVRMNLHRPFIETIAQKCIADTHTLNCVDYSYRAASPHESFLVQMITYSSSSFFLFVLLSEKRSQPQHLK